MNGMEAHATGRGKIMTHNTDGTRNEKLYMSAPFTIQVPTHTADSTAFAEEALLRDADGRVLRFHSRTGAARYVTTLPTMVAAGARILDHGVYAGRNRGVA